MDAGNALERRLDAASSYGPSGRLPIELLSEIFLMCLSDTMDGHNTIDMPLLLSQICSRWRSAAIANPKLWSRLCVQLTPQSISQPELVDTWLKRSGGCPLKIFVFWEKTPFSNSHPVLERLMDNSERWETMFFYLPVDAFRSFSRVRNRLPMLSELSLGTSDDANPSSVSAFDMFEIAPRLRSLESVNLTPTSFHLPWKQLEEIPMFSVDIEDSLSILYKSKHLSRVSFMFVGGNPQDWHPPPVQTHPNSPSLPSHFPFIFHNHLTHFTIMTPVWNESVNLGALFPRLSFPHLESLTICNIKSPLGSEFIQFLSKLHTLRTLHLRKTAIMDDVLVEGLKHLPTLTQLIVLSSSGGAHSPIGSSSASMTFEPEATVTRYLFDALTRNIFSNDAIDGMLLPRLEKLELTISSTAETELDTFVDMIQSRLRDEAELGLASLTHVRVRPYVELDEEFLIRLVEVRDAGVEVEVEAMQMI
ncbi:hypothetical protein CVT24_004411 [Panaeolus cyanescens]|uniref:Uncharacterized protein n=1 Tax=Panaeolus cyanescens TaxID=181874 RepID=A0A409VEJ8_9AGAR|nr:hypothetical protein CVT24_004411 [Panaeolus cyanescens]